MLDPEHKPSAGREIAHRVKGYLAVLLAAAVLIGGGYFVWDKATTFITTFGEIPDYPGPGGDAVTVTIEEGSSLDQIGGTLREADVIKSTEAWDKAAGSEPRARGIQAGKYRMRKQMKARDAMTLLVNPGESRIRAQFRVTEGLRLSEQIDALVKGTKISKKDFEKALKKPKDLGLPSYAKNNPEGVLFPETYELVESATATSVLKQMTAQYAKVTKDIDLADRAKAIGRKPYEVLIVASILEKEVRKPEDRPKAARVIYNRLAKKWPLGLDSTVLYATNSTSAVTTPKQRESKSPYNTYKKKGLPPGPISAPGKAALEAALNPADGPWMYFVTVNLDTGETKFVETEAEFEKIKGEFQAWCQANKGRCK
ncbi:MAG TPA: endolytic transglycosylase MltG [Microlunatus sp.]|nr:endolytic transglycosylase MltG [Microlunatus sp.]